MRLVLFFLLFLVANIANAAPMLTKSFCGAHGYGDSSTAFSESSGFNVCYVNTSADTGGSPTAGADISYTGTLRQCLLGLTGPRRIVLLGSRNIRLLSPLAVTNSYGDFVIVGQASRTQISGADFDYDTTGFNSRLFVFYRWDDAKDAGVQHIRFRLLRSTGTSSNSTNYTQAGGNMTIEQVEGIHLWHNTFSHSNDDSIASYGASSGKGYNQEILIQDNLFVSAVNHKVFPKHLIVLPSGTSVAYPTSPNTCGHTIYRNAFLGNARTPEYKCKDVEIVNNYIIGGGNINYEPIHLKGDNYPDVRYNLFGGASGTQQGRVINMSYAWGGGTPTYEGFHAIGTLPNYLVEGNWKGNGVQWTNSEEIAFKQGNTLVLPRPTPNPARSPIGRIPEANIIKTSAIDLRDSVVPSVGVYQHYNCDGTVNSYRDKLDRLAAKELMEQATYQRSTELQDGDEPTMSGIGACTDTDGDGMFDAYETRFGLNPAVADPVTQDTDSDGIPDMWEYDYGMNPTVSDASGC